MRKLVASMGVVCVAYPLFAWAQSPVMVKYCNDLADAYRKARAAGKPVQPRAGNAIAQCPTNPDDSITTLEAALKAMKVELPPR